MKSRKATTKRPARRYQCIRCRRWSYDRLAVCSSTDAVWLCLAAGLAGTPKIKRRRRNRCLTKLR